MTESDLVLTNSMIDNCYRKKDCFNKNIPVSLITDTYEAVIFDGKEVLAGFFYLSSRSTIKIA